MSIIKKTNIFLLPYLILVCIGTIGIINYPKLQLHLLLTENRCTFSDCFFRIWTELGGNLPYIIIGILFLYRYSIGLYLTAAQLLGSLFSVVLKHTFHLPRPKAYFHQLHSDFLLPHIHDMHLHSYNSMPSGHTITAFAFFYALALICKHKKMRFIYLVAAVLVSYSRVYLSQHFISDVIVGSFIGIFCAIILYPWYKELNKSVKDRSLLNRKFRVNTKRNILNYIQ